MPLLPRVLVVDADADASIGPGGDLDAAAAPGVAAGPAVALVPDGDLLALVSAVGRRPGAPGLAIRGAVASSEPAAAARRRALRLSLPPTLRRPLHPLLDRAAPLHSFEVDGYRTKAAVVAAVSLLAGAAGLRRRAIEGMEQALDEMLLNALLDAPVDAAGRSRYRHLPAPARVALTAPPGERARVLCGADADRFVVSVRDRFGSLRRRTVLAYLDRCARAQAARQDPLEHQSGGAGVGLFLIASACTELLFRLRRGRLSEVTCAFTMRPGAPRLEALYIDDDQDGEAGSKGDDDGGGDT